MALQPGAELREAEGGPPEEEGDGQMCVEHQHDLRGVPLCGPGPDGHVAVMVDRRTGGERPSTWRESAEEPVEHLLSGAEQQQDTPSGYPYPSDEGGHQDGERRESAKYREARERATGQGMDTRPEPDRQQPDGGRSRDRPWAAHAWRDGVGCFHDPIVSLLMTRRYPERRHGAPGDRSVD